MTLKAHLFIVANKASAVVYGSVTDGGGCVYRLADGTVWKLTRADCRDVGHPRWAHLRKAA